MKINDVIKTDKTVIEQLRDIRDKISLDIKDLSSDQLKEYLSKQKTLHSSEAWQTDNK